MLLQPKTFPIRVWLAGWYNVCSYIFRKSIHSRGVRTVI